MDHDEMLQALQLLNVPKTHVTVGLSNLIASSKQYRSLFINRRLPDVGWSDVQIQHLLLLLSTLDTNNKMLSRGHEDDEDDVNENSTTTRWCGVGEREGRVYSSLVAHRHYGLAHGMYVSAFQIVFLIYFHQILCCVAKRGRSGDIMEPQPKAVGSSVLVRLTLLLVLDIIRRGSGLNSPGPAAYGILLPMCTGMSMALVLSSIRDPKQPEKNLVLWSRIDQKTCFKAIQSAGLECMVVPTVQQGDQVETDMVALEAALSQHHGRVLAVITTASCFAPRVPDHIDQVAQLCAKENVFHMINNAYGLQCDMTSKRMNRACVVGRVDAIVCSTDKNFLVPVGACHILLLLACSRFTLTRNWFALLERVDFHM
jgi:O-phospho-L-seryl-tRNASec:L-selenocysteinyl-tRNA synthase